MDETQLSENRALLDEIDALQRRLMELEEIEVMRVSEELERFDSLQVLDEYAKQLEESRDKLARLLRAGAAVQEAKTEKEALQRIADAVGESGWSAVTVSLFRDWDIAVSAYYGCTDADIEFLENHRRSPEDRAKLFGPEFERFKVSRSYLIPADRLGDVMSLDQVVPGRRTVQPGDTWDPMDLAYVPLYGSGGQVIGSINCDDPSDGRRPNAETFFYLELFADLAARKVEGVQLLDRQKRTEEALRQSEEKYRTIFSRSGDGFFLMDELFRDCNSKACELWRCTPEDIVGHSPIEFSPEYQPDSRLSSVAATEYIHKAMGGEPQAFYWKHKCKDGTLIDCEVSLAAVLVADEKLVLAIVRDITERKGAELERETILRVLKIANTCDLWDQMVPQIFQEIGALVPIENYYLALYDSDTNVVTFPYFKDEKDDPPPPHLLSNGLTGWIIRNGKPLLLSPGDFDRMVEAGEVDPQGSPAASWLGVPLSIQSRTVGALVVQSYHTEGLFTEDHLRTLAAIAAQIATALNRARSEEALRFTQFAVDHAADGILWIGAQGQLRYANEAACRNLGYVRRELFSMFIHEIEPNMLADDWPRYWQLVKSEGMSSTETYHRAKDGHLFPVEVTANYVELMGEELLSVFVRDITERKRSERELVTLRKAIEASGEAIFMTDSKGIITFVNTEFTRIYGYRPDEVVNKATPRVLKSGNRSREAYTAFWEKILDGQVVLGEFVNRTKDGRQVTIEGSVNPVLDDEGKIAGFFAVQRDISHRVHEEAALRESEENLQWLVENLDEAVGIIDLEEYFVYANPAMGDIFGLPNHELIGRCLSDFMTAEQFKVVQANTRTRYEGVRSRYLNEIIRANGEVRRILVTATPQFGQNGHIRNVLAVCKDVTFSAN